MPARRISCVRKLQVLFWSEIDHAEVSDDEWRDFLFIRSNVKGPHYERWRHVHGCGRFFNALRDTVSDRFLTTYKAGEARPALTAFTEPKA